MFNLAGNDLTTILYHRFFFDGEPRERSRDRLKRQCEWLRNNFSPLNLERATRALAANQLPSRPLLITIDDAKIEILDVVDIFESFELPISVFVCVGWSATESPDPDSLLARTVNQIEWYAGPTTTIETARGEIRLGADAQETRKAIDLILAHSDGPPTDFEAVWSALGGSRGPEKRISCSWSELADLMVTGVGIGGHSVSHVNLAQASPCRMKFEISETRRILSAKFGSCDVFAYPYGMSHCFSSATTAELARQGFQYGFLTHSDFAGTNTDPLCLPRISLPDRIMSHPEFCLRVAGAGVVYRKIKQSGVLRRKGP